MAISDSTSGPPSFAGRLEHGFVRLNQALIVLLMASMAVLVFATPTCTS